MLSGVYEILQRREKALLCLHAVSCATGNGLLAPYERSTEGLFTPHCTGLVVVGRLLPVSDPA
jgi:hypothetical protein